MMCFFPEIYNCEIFRVHNISMKISASSQNRDKQKIDLVFPMILA